MAAADLVPVTGRRGLGIHWTPHPRPALVDELRLRHQPRPPPPLTTPVLSTTLFKLASWHDHFSAGIRTGRGALVEFRILGTIELRSGDRRSELNSKKERCTLAALSWDAGRPVSFDALAGRVWDDSPPRRFHASLYTYASRIRRALQEVGGPDAPPLVRKAHTYTLEVDADAVDLHHYLRLTAEARALAEGDDPLRCLRLLDEAAGLWRGEPLAGLSGQWVEHIRATFAERSLAAASTYSTIQLRLGRFEEVVENLSALINAHPTNETIIGNLVLALHGCGRTAEATGILQRTSRRLRDEFGTEPGADFQRLQQGVLNGVPASELLSPPKAAKGTGAGRVCAPDNLPRDVPWVGRDAELRQLSAALAASSTLPRSVVTLEAIDGMGGVGKTSLAVHIGHQLRERFPDGRIYLDLHAHSSFQEPLSPTAALHQLLRLLGTPVQQIPHGLDELTSMWRTLLTDRRAFVILDDAADPEQVRPLLPGASPSVVIITSRRRLTGLPGVRPIFLDVLPLHDAVALFNHRVGVERSVTPEEGAHIARLCGCLPLAIEIAASRFTARTSWGAKDLIRRLAREGGRLAEIRDGYREIARTFEFSYRSLTAEQRSAFRRLGLHVGAEFGAYAAAALTGRSLEDTERILEDLINCHLLLEPSPHRYRIHDLLREYAQILAMSEDDSTVRDLALERLLDFYAATADRADHMLRPHRCRTDLDLAHPPPESPVWLDRAGPQDWFSAESANLLAVLEYVRMHGSPRRQAHYANVLAGFLGTEGYWNIATPLHQEAVAYWHDVGDGRAEAHALVDLAEVRALSGDYPSAISCADRALILARASGDREVEAEALHQLAITYWHEGRCLEALPLENEALTIRMGQPDRLQQARCLNNMGIMLLGAGRHHEALGCFRDALTRFREMDDPRGQCRTLNNLAELYRETGRIDDACRAYRKALALSRANGSRWDQATVQMNLADTLRSSGDLRGALDVCQEALVIFRELGDRRSESVAANEAGRTLAAAGRDDEAMAHHMAALELAQRIGAAAEEAQALRDLGQVELRTGRTLKATEHLEAALAVTRRIQAPAEEARTLEALAQLWEGRDRADTAATLRQDAKSIINRLNRSKDGAIGA
ncbi:tetratricopeptide repeat protein [Streptomyces sp. XD-27]|uniref:AfsR/SARP family transcriptional regulator n=1 Tax=Streptomyces sp. XD-27 TaxID=3062779 RepID=UPI0026F41EFB|nr:tetratricopeptide repeat protein [Streptomyces sp. XD-27]WKX68798.1 tetratricopeptide repeat protein [Streptomyces sp. XD-27]